MNYTKNQQLFIDEVFKGSNIYLSGKAGTGKTYISKEAIQLLKKLGKKVACVAPTGLAANNLGGQTIHSMFSITPSGVASFETCNFMKSEKRRMMDLIDTLIIDEISMLRCDVLDAMEWTLLKNGCQSLLTKQIIFVGDLKQLPCIVADNERSVMYRDYDNAEFTHAKVYKKLKPLELELDEIKRQSDSEFINALNEVREGRKSEYFRQFVHTEPNGIILAPHNTTVDKYNKIGLDAVKHPELVFNAKVEGNAKADEFNVQSTIRVKQTAKIMYLMNAGDLVNGSQGMFITYKGNHYIRVGEIDYPLEPFEFTKREYVLNEEKTDLVLRETGKIIQYPFRLAYALSIHKSQGLTFDEVSIDLSRPCFVSGQLYVALSRASTPKGLRILL